MNMSQSVQYVGRLFANRLHALNSLNQHSLPMVYIRGSWFSSCSAIRALHKKVKEANEKGGHGHDFYERSTTPWQNEAQLVDLICNSVIFENENVIAFNKPNGLPMAISLKDQLNPELLSSVAVTEQLSMQLILPAIKKRLSLGDLSPVYSTSRLYSGVVVYSKRKEVSEKLHKYFLSTICQKMSYQSFQLISLGILDPPVGGGEILMRKAEKDQNYGMIVKTAGKRNSKVSRCHIQYTTLSRNEELNCSLVQIKPVTVRNDSIHIYLNSKFAPILGDHKYGNLVGTFMEKKILLDLDRRPSGLQKLPSNIRKKLHLKSTIETCIPLHVHCESVQLPISRRKKELITIEAPLPTFFTETMQRLSLDSDCIDQGSEMKALEL